MSRVPRMSPSACGGRRFPAVAEAAANQARFEDAQGELNGLKRDQDPTPRRCQELAQERDALEPRLASDADKKTADGWSKELSARAKRKPRVRRFRRSPGLGAKAVRLSFEELRRIGQRDGGTGRATETRGRALLTLLA